MEACLDERFNLAPLLQLLLPHSFCYPERIALDASNDGMREGPLLGPFIVLFDNDDLLAGLTSLEDNSNLHDMVEGEPLRMPHGVEHSDLSGLVNWAYKDQL